LSHNFIFRIFSYIIQPLKNDREFSFTCNVNHQNSTQLTVIADQMFVMRVRTYVGSISFIKHKRGGEDNMIATGERATLKVWRRDTTNSRSSKKLRRAGFVPASISIRGRDSISVKIKRDELMKNLKKYGRTYLFKLDVDGEETYTAIVRNMQHAAVGGELLDVSFQHVSLDEEIKVEVGIRITGKEAIEARKLLVVTQLDSRPVKGLPQDIPEYLAIDVSELEADDKITVGDIPYPEGIEPDCESDKIVLVITEAKSSDEEGSQESGEDQEEQKETE